METSAGTDCETTVGNVVVFGKFGDWDVLGMGVWGGNGCVDNRIVETDQSASSKKPCSKDTDEKTAESKNGTCRVISND